MKSLKSFFLATLLILFASLSFAQSTTTGTMRAQSDKSNWVWTVSSGDFDSTDVVWSESFYFEKTDRTFDANGTMDLGAGDAGGTFSTVLLLYGTVDGGNSWQLCDSLGTITATTSTKFNVDLDDWDETASYKFKATNGGGDNSFIVGIKRED